MGIALKREVQQRLGPIVQRYSIGQIGSVLLAIPAICLALVLLGVADLRKQEQRNERNIQAIEQSVRKSEQVLRYIIDQETGVRGYLLTQDQQFLQPYYVARQELAALLTELKQSAPEQSNLTQQLEQEVQQRLQQAEGLLKFAEAMASKATSSLFVGSRVLTNAESEQLLQQLRQAKQTTDRIRQTIEEFRQQQQLLLSRKQAQVLKGKDFVDQVQLLGALLSVLSYVGVVSLFQLLDRGMVQRDQEIQRSQDMMQSLTNQLVDGVIMIDQRGQIDSLNPSAERMLGHSAQVLIGQSLFDILFPSELSPPLSLDIAAWVEAKAQTGVVEQLQAQQADGQTIPIELSISRTTTVPPKWVALIRDVSERVQLTEALSGKVIELGDLNRQLFVTNTTLQRQNQSLEAFVKAAAHDLKTPIRGIASLAQWLETDLNGSLSIDTRHSLRLINQRVLRLQAIADGLLNYASIDNWIERQAIVSVKALIEGVCRQIAVPDRFTVTIPPEMPTLKTSYLALQLVFEQLIRNSIDHHDRDRGIIEIMATPQEHCIEFIVQDDGPGIAPAYRSLVLQMFQVLDQNPDASENIGVGLALVDKTVQLMGGSIDLRSATVDELGHDRGLAVHFTWPYLDSE